MRLTDSHRQTRTYAKFAPSHDLRLRFISPRLASSVVHRVRYRVEQVLNSIIVPSFIKVSVLKCTQRFIYPCAIVVLGTVATRIGYYMDTNAMSSVAPRVELLVFRKNNRKKVSGVPFSVLHFFGLSVFTLYRSSTYTPIERFEPFYRSSVSTPIERVSEG